MGSRALTIDLATRIYLKYTGDTVDQVRRVVEYQDGFLVETYSEDARYVPVDRRVIPLEPSRRCHGRDFSTFSVRVHTPGVWPLCGVAVIWEDEALYSMESASEFRAFVERVRSSIEAVELASLVATFRGKAEYHPYQHLFLDDSDLDTIKKGTPPGEIDQIDGLGPLRVKQDSTTGMVLDFFSFWLPRSPMTVHFVRWHVELGPEGLSWRSSLVAAVPYEPTG